MNINNTNSIFIHACGFVSAMGSKLSHVHACINSRKRSNMQPDAQILNTKATTVIGRVKENLPPIPERFERYKSRNNQLALSALEQIQPDIEKAIKTYGKNRIAVVIGTSTSGIYDGEVAYAERLTSGKFPTDYHYYLQELGNCSDFIADYFGLTGGCYSISTACSSSARVFISAQRLLKSGIADAVIIGGVDSICSLTLNGFAALEALSFSHCRPFSEQRDGINIGEAAAFMLLSLEPAEVALLGCGDSSDAHHISAPHPNGDGAEEAMRKALKAARLQPKEIGYINAHGTATPLNDSMESRAIYRIFANSVPVSSSKHLTGHTLGAAGAVEAAIAWHILKYNLNLPQQNCQNKAQDILVTLVDEPMKLKKRAIMSNSFAFGGNNVSLIFGEING